MNVNSTSRPIFTNTATTTTASDNEPARVVKDIEELFEMIKTLPPEYQPILAKIVFILAQLEQKWD